MPRSQAQPRKTRPAAPRTRPTLDREAVLRAGLALANEEGLDAVSIRRVAEALSVTPMALYRYVSDKSDLLAGILEVVVRDAAVTGHEDADWREWLCETFLRMAGAMLEQRGVMALIGTVGAIGPATLPVVESILARLRGAGFPPREAAELFQELNRYMLGAVASDNAFSPNPTARDRERKTRASLELLSADDFPILTEHAAAMAGAFASRDLEPGLRRIIDAYASKLPATR